MTHNQALEGLIHAIAIRDALACHDETEAARLREMASDAADRAGIDGLTDAAAYLAGWTDTIGGLALAESDFQRDVFADARRRRAEAVGRVMERRAQ